MKKSIYILACKFFGYQVHALKTHYALTARGAMEWMACYPRWAGNVAIEKNGKLYAYRSVFNSL